jgi:ABC-2 type transport system ATP-binding protein
VIEAKNLSKAYKSRRQKKVAVDDLSFVIEPGKVTGFVGPNGAGKSTTMRLMLGLDSGEGRTTYDGRALNKYSQPAKVVGTLLEAKGFHPTRSARNHLRILAAEGGIPDSRVDEVLEIVGLTEVAKKGPGKFSLGMAQRLGIAAAILGEPKYLMLDEPANGLDPEGMLWLRNFIRDYAKHGRGVLISSHLLSELSQMVDNVVVIGKGRLISSATVKELTSKGRAAVFVRATNQPALESALRKAGFNFSKKNGGLEVADSRTDDIGIIAHDAKLTLLELTGQKTSLEDAFLELTEDAQEYRGSIK